MHQSQDDEAHAAENTTQKLGELRFALEALFEDPHRVLVGPGG